MCPEMGRINQVTSKMRIGLSVVQACQDFGTASNPMTGSYRATAVRHPATEVLPYSAAVRRQYVGLHACFGAMVKCLFHEYMAQRAKGVVSFGYIVVRLWAVIKGRSEMGVLGSCVYRPPPLPEEPGTRAIFILFF